MSEMAKSQEAKCNVYWMPHLTFEPNELEVQFPSAEAPDARQEEEEEVRKDQLEEDGREVAAELTERCEVLGRRNKFGDEIAEQGACFVNEGVPVNRLEGNVHMHEPATP